MSCKPKFFQSEHCGNIIEVICCDQKEDFKCCGEPMKEMTANTTEGAAEKHMPVVEKDGNNITVKVGSVFHPMTEEHSISWVYLETKKGCQRMYLSPNEEPAARFAIAEGDTAVAAYAYCNLHGFWKTDIK